MRRMDCYVSPNAELTILAPKPTARYAKPRLPMWGRATPCSASVGQRISTNHNQPDELFPEEVSSAEKARIAAGCEFQWPANFLAHYDFDEPCPLGWAVVEFPQQVVCASALRKARTILTRQLRAASRVSRTRRLQRKLCQKATPW